MRELVFGPMALIKSIRPQAMQVGMEPKVFAFFLFGGIGPQDMFESCAGFPFFAGCPPDLEHPSCEDLCDGVQVSLAPSYRGEELVRIVIVVSAFENVNHRSS